MFISLLRCEFSVLTSLDLHDNSLFRVWKILGRMLLCLFQENRSGAKLQRSYTALECPPLLKEHFIKSNSMLALLNRLKSLWNL